MLVSKASCTDDAPPETALTAGSFALITTRSDDGRSGDEDKGRQRYRRRCNGKNILAECAMPRCGSLFQKRQWSTPDAGANGINLNLILEKA